MHRTNRILTSAVCHGRSVVGHGGFYPALFSKTCRRVMNRKLLCNFMQPRMPQVVHLLPALARRAAAPRPRPTQRARRQRQLSLWQSRRQQFRRCCPVHKRQARGHQAQGRGRFAKLWLVVRRLSAQYRHRRTRRDRRGRPLSPRPLSPRPSPRTHSASCMVRPQDGCFRLFCAHLTCVASLHR